MTEYKTKPVNLKSLTCYVCEVKIEKAEASMITIYKMLDDHYKSEHGMTIAEYKKSDAFVPPFKGESHRQGRNTSHAVKGSTT